MQQCKPDDFWSCQMTIQKYNDWVLLLINEIGWTGSESHSLSMRNKVECTDIS